MSRLDDVRGRRWVARMVAVCIGGVLVSGVTAAQDTTRSLWKWQERYVRIEAQAERDAPPNEHPVRFTPQQIGVMLYGLKVQVPNKRRFFSRSRDEQQSVPVFSDRELQVLSDAVSRGLAQAGPREDVVFVTTGNVDRAFAGTLKERELNTGRVFYRDGRLNIIFGEVHGEFPEPRGAGALVAYPAQIPRPGIRNKTRSHDWSLVLDQGIALHQEGDTPRTDWVTIDPDAAVARYEKEQRLKEQASPEAVVKGTSELAAGQEALRRKVEALQREVGAEAQGDVSKPGAAPAAVAAPAPKKATAAPDSGVATAAPPPGGELERRLRILKRLRDQGLLSEEIYKAQVEQALKEGL